MILSIVRSSFSDVTAFLFDHERKIHLLFHCVRKRVYFPFLLLFRYVGAYEGCFYVCKLENSVSKHWSPFDITLFDAYAYINTALGSKEMGVPNWQLQKTPLTGMNSSFRCDETFLLLVRLIVSLLRLPGTNYIQAPWNTCIDNNIQSIWRNRFFFVSRIIFMSNL